MGQHVAPIHSSHGLTLLFGTHAADDVVRLWDVRNLKTNVAAASDLHNPYDLCVMLI